MHVLGWDCDTHIHTTCEKVPKNGERKRVVKHLKRKKSQRVRVASEPSPKYVPTLPDLSTVSVYLDPIRQSYMYPRASESQYNGLMALQIVFRVKPCDTLCSLGACMLCSCYPPI